MPFVLQPRIVPSVARDLDDGLRLGVLALEEEEERLLGAVRSGRCKRPPIALDRRAGLRGDVLDVGRRARRHVLLVSLDHEHTAAHQGVRERCPRRNFSRAFEQLAAEQRLKEAPSDVGDGRTVGCGSGEAQLPPGGSRPEKITPASSLEQRFEAVAAAEVEERALEVESAVRLQHSCELPGTDPAREPGARDDDDVDFVVGEWKLSVPLRREDADVSEAPPLDHPAEAVVIGDPGPDDHLVTQLRNRREGRRCKATDCEHSSKLETRQEEAPVRTIDRALQVRAGDRLRLKRLFECRHGLLGQRMRGFRKGPPRSRLRRRLGGSRTSGSSAHALCDPVRRRRP